LLMYKPLFLFVLKKKGEQITYPPLSID